MLVDVYWLAQHFHRLLCSVHVNRRVLFVVSLVSNASLGRQEGSASRSHQHQPASKPAKQPTPASSSQLASQPAASSQQPASQLSEIPWWMPHMYAPKSACMRATLKHALHLISLAHGTSLHCMALRHFAMVFACTHSCAHQCGHVRTDPYNGYRLIRFPKLSKDKMVILLIEVTSECHYNIHWGAVLTIPLGE